MDNLQKLRSGGNNHLAANNIGVIGNRGMQSSNGTPPQRSHSQMYLNPGPLMPGSVRNGDVEDLNRGIRSMNFHGQNYGQASQAESHMAAHSTASGGVHLGQPMSYVYHQNGFMPLQGTYYQQTGAPGMHPSANFYGAANAPMMNPAIYNGYAGAHMNDSPPSWPSSRVTSTHMQTLATPRRSSGGSTNDPEGPGTPFTQFTGFATGLPMYNNSPESLLALSSPSPTQTRYTIPKPYPGVQIPLHLQILTQQSPVIPKAVPAPFSPTKSLDRRLENPQGITNVYIRGLQPDTTDEGLQILAKRFGDIDSSKAIIDMNTGMCKGFGFVKFFNYKDAEDCIRGFAFCGYETSFARESFYSQLKKLSDGEATNLYISNLPTDFNEHDLGAIFDGYEVCSKRILRSPDGSGRGVGFARFPSHEACEKVIRDFNNHTVAKDGCEPLKIQIRYADTPEQKALKQQTTAARQYRSAEYESQTFPTTTGAGSSRVAGDGPIVSYVPNSSNGYQSLGYDASNGLSAYTGGTASHISPGSAKTAMNFHVSYDSYVNGASRSTPIDDEDKTIHAPTPTPVKNEDLIHVDSQSER